jgi:hypothetical protein
MRRVASIPAQLRHRDIHDDDIGPQRSGLIHGLAAIAGFGHDLHVVL